MSKKLDPLSRSDKSLFLWITLLCEMEEKVSRFLSGLLRHFPHDKGRFELDRERIRAKYGHTIPVNKEWSEKGRIPEKLYHGTNPKKLKGEVFTTDSVSPEFIRILRKF